MTYITASPDFLLAIRLVAQRLCAGVRRQCAGDFYHNFINSRLAHRLGAATLAGAGCLASLLALVMNVALLGATPAMGWVVRAGGGG